MLSSRRVELCRGEFRRRILNNEYQREWYALYAGGRPRGLSQVQVLLRGIERDVWKGAPDPAAGGHAIPSKGPYGISKVSGFYLTLNYREAYDMFCCSGILFNHESPRRGFEFVTRKITSHVARIKLGLASELRLGNLDAKRDWGHAADYVRAMHAIVQQPAPDDFVIAMGETHTVREFCELAFGEVNLDYSKYVVEYPQFFRPAEVDLLIGDPSKAREALSWEPQYTFWDLVKEMVQQDMRELQKTELQKTELQKTASMSARS